MRLRSPFDARFGLERPWLFVRGLYAILAGDCWVEMVPHAGRYGVDGFNVAHFRWLDRLLPLPSAALYAGLLVFTGTVCAFCAGFPALRLPRAVAFVAYTLAWSMSMHDSYQHHYLLSWLLLAAALLPEYAVYRDPKTRRAAAPAPGFALASITCAIVYSFTAVAKFAADWRDGAVLRVLARSHAPGSSTPGPLDGLRDLALHTGLAEASFWRIAAQGTATLQGVVALGYLVAIDRDRPGASRVRGVFTWAAFGCAAAFHLGAERSGIFAIGWFSAYMVLLACVALLPRAPLCALVAGVGRVATRPACQAMWRALVVRPRAVAVASALSVTTAVTIAGYTHVPGSALGVALAASFLALASARSSYADRARAARAGVAGVVATLAFCACFGGSDVAFDYHRRLAGELLMLGRDDAALAAYREAERVAPRGQSRQGKIRALEGVLRARRHARP